MIIDDEHQVAFLHIPKCGGTSVRKQLEAIDSYKDFFHNRRPHERLGKIDYAHIPLPFLAEAFPEAFDKVARYQSFALVRDPHARFASSTFQRLALFRGVRRTTATVDLAIREAEETIAWLQGRDHFCDDGYIHFARQSDYIKLDGRQVVHNIFALDDLEGFGAALSKLTGAPFDAGRRENTNFANSNRVLTMLHAAKPIYSRLSSWKQREKLLHLLHRLKIQSPDAFYARFRANRTISAFVESYYAEDFALWRAAKARAEARRRGDPPGAAREAAASPSYA